MLSASTKTTEDDDGAVTAHSELGFYGQGNAKSVEGKEQKVYRKMIVSAITPETTPSCFLKDTKRAKYTSASDEDALKAYQLVSKLENISPSLEPSHAFAEAIRIAPKLKSSEVIIVNSCGDSLKDKDIIKQKLGSYIR